MMNKTEFNNALKEKLNVDDAKMAIINNVLDDHFLIGKNNKNKIITDFMDKLNVDETKANEIYNTIISFIGSNIKNKLKHPFGN